MVTMSPTDSSEVVNQNDQNANADASGRTPAGEDIGSWIPPRPVAGPVTDGDQPQQRRPVPPAGARRAVTLLPWNMDVG